MPTISTKIGGVTIADGEASNLTLDATCDVTAATGAGGGPATELDANGTTLTVDAITDGQFLKRVGTTIVSAAVSGTGDLLSTNNLSDVANAGTSRTNLGLGTIATQAANNVSISGGAVTGITDITVADGGTGASTAAGALTNLGAEPVTCIARGTAAAVAVNSVSVVNQASVTNTVAAGDTYSFYLAGYVLNNSGGTRTYTIRVTIGATTFDLAIVPTYVTSATAVGWLNVVADIAVISSSSIACTIQARAGASAAVATAQNNVLANDRNIVRTSANNETGSKTIAIGILSNDATATQTFTRTRAEIYKGAAI